ncbi:cation acetate symporter [Nocardioidaceae bacterium]|nr:cation acetate symporter [Nocardioidaceae bacterium]
MSASVEVPLSVPAVADGLVGGPAPPLVAVLLVVGVTLAVGIYGLRFSRTTSDFMVASRSVGPRLNAAAISGEYISAASFLGIAGLLLVHGAQMLWYPIGWTAGYLVMLALVAAPLRRSGAYTLPDFTEARFDSRRLRTVTAVLVLGIGWLYLLPQFQGAGITLALALGTPTWVGPVAVSVVVLANVMAGGMRSITFVQAMQYWLKLTALLLPAAVMLAVWVGQGRPQPTLSGGLAGTRVEQPAGVGGAAGAGVTDWSLPLVGDGALGLYATWSLVLATFLGTMGLPHVVVRFYTNPDGTAARRTTLTVLGLLGAFYLLPPIYGALGRAYADGRVESVRSDVFVLELPALVLGGGDGAPDGLGQVVAVLLTALLTAGAFAAFLATSSGLVVAVSGVLSQEVTNRAVRGRRLVGLGPFRAGAVVAAAVPLVLALALPHVGIARTVGLAFAVAASTFAPLLVLGIWWRGLTAAGAYAGVLAGGLGSGAAVLSTLGGAAPGPLATVLLGQPAAWSVPLAVLVMVVVSRFTAPVEGVDRILARLHLPEDLLTGERPRAERPPL